MANPPRCVYHAKAAAKSSGEDNGCSLSVFENGALNLLTLITDDDCPGNPRIAAYSLTPEEARRLAEEILAASANSAPQS